MGPLGVKVGDILTSRTTTSEVSYTNSVMKNIVNKRRFMGSRGGSCECICHKRVTTNDYCGYCSGSHYRAGRS